MGAGWDEDRGARARVDPLLLSKTVENWMVLEESLAIITELGFYNLLGIGLVC